MVDCFVFNTLYVRKKYLSIFMSGENKLDFDKIMPGYKFRSSLNEKYGCYSNALNVKIRDDGALSMYDDAFVAIHFETVGDYPKKWVEQLHELNVAFEFIWFSSKGAGRFLSRIGYVPFIDKFEDAYEMLDSIDGKFQRYSWPYYDDY